MTDPSPMTDPRLVWPDPHYQPPTLTLAKQIERYINHVYIYLYENGLWTVDESGRDACLACGNWPHPYALRADGNFNNHANSRNTPHTNNVIWLIINKVLKPGLERGVDLTDKSKPLPFTSFPVWPLCYKPADRTKRMWCLICRRPIYPELDEQIGLEHDAWHQALFQVPMGQFLRRIRSGGRPVKKHFIEEILASQHEPTIDPLRERAPGPVPPGPVPTRKEPSFGTDDDWNTHYRKGRDILNQGSAQEHSGPTSDDEYPSFIWMRVEGKLRRLEASELDTLEPDGAGGQVSTGCTLYDLHANMTPGFIRRPCRVKACSCSCHTSLIDDVVQPPNESSDEPPE